MAGAQGTKRAEGDGIEAPSQRYDMILLTEHCFSPDSGDRSIVQVVIVCSLWRLRRSRIDQF